MFNNSHNDNGCSKLRVMLEGEIDAVSKQSERKQNLELMGTALPAKVKENDNKYETYQ